jgi:hypothetical protein
MRKLAEYFRLVRDDAAVIACLIVFVFRHPVHPRSAEGSPAKAHD